MNCGPSGSSAHGILQARILEQVAVPSSRGSSPPRERTHVSYSAGGFFTTELYGKVKVKMKLLSPVWLFATPWTVAYQASLSMGFSPGPLQKGYAELQFMLVFFFSSTPGFALQSFPRIRIKSKWFSKFWSTSWISCWKSILLIFQNTVTSFHG